MKLKQPTKPNSYSKGSAPLPTRPSRPPRGDRTACGAGVRLKILSGDDPVVVKRLAGLVGLNPKRFFPALISLR